MEGERYFGNKDGFAIRYKPFYREGILDSKYAYCHFVLKGQVIGELKECCYISTWMASAFCELEKFGAIPSVFYSPEFENRTDVEIFELLIKANQLEEEYKPEFYYLPVVDGMLWDNCILWIDETIDAYLIYKIEMQGKIRFIWQAWREPSSQQEIGKIYSVEVDKHDVITTLRSALNFLKQEYQLV